MSDSQGSVTTVPMDGHSLEQDDIKAQFNSTASPYGILFPEHHNLDSKLEDSSPFALTFTLGQDKEPRRGVPSASQLPATNITKQGKSRHPKDETLSNSQQSPSTRTAFSGDLNVHEPASEQSPFDDKVHGRDKETPGVFSPGDTTFTDKSNDSIEWDSSNRGPGAGKDYRGSKSGSKLAKGWKKFRQSLRQSPFKGQDVKHVYGSRSSITEERQSELLSVSSVGGRKTVSDMDNPLEFDIEEPSGTKSFKSRFRSGSLKELLHKSPPAFNLSELEVGDSQSIRGASKDAKGGLQGGAVVVDVETIIGLGEMRQYSRDDQQEQSQHPSEKLPLSETGNIESGYGPLLSSSSSATEDCQSQLELDESSSDRDLDVADQSPQDQQNRGSGNTDSLNSGEDGYKAFSDNTLIQAEYSFEEVPQEMSEESHKADELVNSSGQFLSLGHSSSQRWRLSTEGTPFVYGMIWESNQRDSCANEHYLRQLMRNSTVDQDTSEDAGSSEELDRQDRTFKVPLTQSVQLASATFESGQRVPLSIYYVTEELRVRGTLIDELFPEDWDTKAEAFEDLVGVFDSRPFGQDYDLSINPSAIPSKVDMSASHEAEESVGMGNLVESLEIETGSSQLESQHSASNDENVDKGILESASRSVTSRDLSRIILRFLTDLPEPLITRDVFSTFSSMVQLQTIDSIKTQASSLLVQMLSLEQRQLLKFLLEFLDEVVFKPLRDDIQRLKQLISMESAEESPSREHQQDLDCKKSYLKEQMERIAKVFGVACTQAVSPKNRADPLAKNQSQNSLYRHYKKEFELKALQEKKALVTRNSQEVFQFLMNYRVGIFGPSFVSLFRPVSEGKVDINSRLTSSAWRGDASQGESDGAHLDRLTLGQSGRSQSCLKLPQISRRLRSHLGPRRLAKRRLQDNMRKRAIVTRRNNQHGIQKIPSFDSLCDSGVEFSSVDLVALAAMEEHKARSMRSKKHLPHPSVATLHSVQVETGSIIYAKDASHENNSGLKSGETQLQDVYEDDISSVITGGAQELEELDHTTSHRQVENPIHKIGVKNFLEEPLDRKHQELEAQMVEKEILRSEMTTKFLTLNLVGLYPSSSPAPIPTIILPTARAMIVQTTKIPGLCSPVEESTTRNRELTLAPQEEIKLPSDHSSAENCSCTYCTTLVKPSKIPVLSRAEYELAELQSQCDGKDQHIAELLKTVQNLQGQVNILNAKLLFLHDHHTTRPMRRRTLARNSYPVMPVAANGQEYTHRKQHISIQQQRSDSGMSGSHSPTDTTNGNSPNMSGFLGAFPEGVQTSNNAAQQNALAVRFSFDLPSLEEGEGEAYEDDIMSFLDLDNSHPPPPPFPAQATQHNQLSRMHATAASNVGHAVNYDRSIMANVRDIRYETELERALREIDEFEEEPEREGEDQLDEHYYLDAYKTMDQQLYRRPVLPVPPPPRPMSSEMYKKHHRMSLPIQSLMSKRISLGNSFRWRGRATAA
ncbi:hypothetical protein BGX26_006145 [Mortierella sp. AD094]|nr:hypothetical protein BGX26_006145 [Mortierella sp. AD094]